MTLITKNLGQVKALHIGTTAPSNTSMLWHDTILNIKKSYNNVTSTWEPFTTSPTLHQVLLVEAQMDTTDVITNSDNSAQLQLGEASANIYFQHVRKILLDSASIDITNGSLNLVDIGQGINIAEGTNARMGNVKLASGTATVSTDKVTKDSRIFLSVNYLSGASNPPAVVVQTRIVGVSFTIKSSDSGDTSEVSWEIKEPI